ncbi:MAG: hypothetical protein ACRD22_16405 [Terriglobia bacterium]
MKSLDDSNLTYSSDRRASSCLKATVWRNGIGRALALCFISMLLCAPAWSQLQRVNKLPGIGKITNPGSGEQAFTGSIQSLDRKQHVLNVSDAQSNDTEIFPIQKKVKISSVGGAKLKLASLTPGANVVVYYEDKQGRRTVTQIVVLSSGASPAKKKTGSS